MNELEKNYLDIYTFAEALCQANGIDYQEILTYHERFGYILSTPSLLIMAHLKIVKNETCWFVELLVGNGGIPYVLSVMPVWCDKIMFARPVRGSLKPKAYKTERICRHFGIDPESLKSRLNVA